jgi:tetraacyldisaccharide 4'-kinase
MGCAVMRAPGFWWRKPGMAAVLLAPAGKLYGAVAARRLAASGVEAAIPVLCIGNPTLGGAGKTPTALAVARLLTDAGARPAFLSRGYGGRLAGPVQVDPQRHDADLVGDEPLLLARLALTIVARDRVAGAAAAAAAGAGIIVMDDGFQNPSLQKRRSLLVIDAGRGVGNGHIFPAGPLRAPLAAQLDRASALLIIGDGPGHASLEVVQQAAAARHLPLFRGRLAPDPAAIAALRARPVLAFAGIGDPEKFFATLAAAGIAAPRRRTFPDHHRYSAAELKTLGAEAERLGLVPLTTEKDAVRLAGAAAGALRDRLTTLPVTLEVEAPEDFRAFVLSALDR